jgi:hypothetical protein
MNSTVMSSIVVAALLIAGGAWYLLSDSGTTESEVAGDPSSEAQLAGAEGSLAALMGRGENVTCNVRHTTEAGESTGTVYVMNGKMRADFTTDSSALGGEVVTSHMINDGEWMYMWSDESPQGMKMSVSEVAAGEEGSSAGMSGSWESFAEAGAYDCTAWTVDASVFSVPGEVSFLELGAAFPSMPNLPAY